MTDQPAQADEAMRLIIYGRHFSDCTYGPHSPCSCGFEAAVQAARADAVLTRAHAIRIDGGRDALAIARELEWCAEFGGVPECCPSCAYIASEGHDTECSMEKLIAWLKRARPTTPRRRSRD